MKRNKGISLIVLVITIIVMIVLAGAIILSLNNAGIIGKANQAVTETNEATVKQLAELKWAEAYLDENVEKTDAALYNAVIKGLETENIDTNQYFIQVTTKGVTVETINEIWYYSSLSLAVNDVNNDGKEIQDEMIVGKKIHKLGDTSDANRDSAIAAAYVIRKTENIEYHVVLLDDFTELKRLSPTRDMTINLSGHELTFAPGEAVGIDGASNHDDKITIDGRVQGSTIIVNGTNKVSRVFQTKTNTFIINGGKYIAKTPTTTAESEYSSCVVFCSSNGKANINGAEMIVEGVLESTDTIGAAGNIVVMHTIHSYGNVELTNCKLYTNVYPEVEYTNSLIAGTYTNENGSILAKDCHIEVMANVKGKDVKVVSCYSRATSKFNNCNIKTTCKNQETKMMIFGAAGYNEIELNQCTISVEANEQSYVAGLFNNSASNAIATKCSISSSGNLIENKGKMYIDSATQNGFSIINTGELYIDGNKQ